MSFIALLGLAYIFLLNAVTAEYSLYKKILFPPSNSSLRAYEIKTGIVSKIECASICSLDSSKCKAYFYYRSNICHLVDFNLTIHTDMENVNVYVDLSMLLQLYKILFANFNPSRQGMSNCRPTGIFYDHFIIMS